MKNPIEYEIYIPEYEISILIKGNVPKLNDEQVKKIQKEMIRKIEEHWIRMLFGDNEEKVNEMLCNKNKLTHPGKT